MKRLLISLLRLPRWPVLVLILLYQMTVSPDHSRLGKSLFPNGYCRFCPSCSAYGHQAINKYGLLYGGAKLLWRILRCNPWNRGGIDELK